METMGMADFGIDKENGVTWRYPVRLRESTAGRYAIKEHEVQQIHEQWKAFIAA